MPEDPFEPHMPAVEVISDLDAFFAHARHRVSAKGERHLVIVTPRRMLFVLPTPAASRDGYQRAAASSEVLGADGPLDISVISYTHSTSWALGETMGRCIPFLGYLIAFATYGHRIVVFEGHSSAFEAGVRGTSLLLVDSGMLPFLQADWAEVAYRVMRSDARVLVHDRQHYRLLPVSRSRQPPGWQYSEPDGEASYLNCLLTTLAKAPRSTVELVSGREVPDLAGLTRDPKELDWISQLPFRYDQLNADEVIRFLLRSVVWGRSGVFKTQGVLATVLALENQVSRQVSFRVVSRKAKAGGQRVTIERL